MSTYSARAVIRTKYLRPSNNRGARIKAMGPFGYKVYPYPYELDNADAHVFAFLQLCKDFHLEWGDKVAVGGDNDFYYFTPICDINTVGVA